MRNASGRILIVLYALMLMVEPVPSDAQAAALTGNFRHVGGVEERQQVTAAIAAATAALPRTDRVRLAALLDDVALPPAVLSVAQDSNTIAVTHGEGQRLQSPRDGSAIEVKAGVELQQRVVDGAIEQTLESEQLGLDQSYRYSLGSDGRTLTVSVELRPAELATPISYSLTYRRD